MRILLAVVSVRLLVKGPGGLVPERIRLPLETEITGSAEGG